MRARQLCLALFLFVLINCQCNVPVDSVRVIFYNKEPTVRKSQLLITELVRKQCPRGQMRDHRNRCRRAIVFSKKK